MTTQYMYPPYVDRDLKPVLIWEEDIASTDWTLTFFDHEGRATTVWVRSRDVLEGETVGRFKSEVQAFFKMIKEQHDNDLQDLRP